MEHQFNSPTSSVSSKKENKWSGEFVDNSPEFNPISYDFLPQRGSPRGDETPVAKKKRTSMKSLGSSPITANTQQRLLPPPPSERLEDLKKFTNLYKELLCGNDDGEQSDSEDYILSDMLNAAENILTNQTHNSSSTITAPAEVETSVTNSLVNNGATVASKQESSSLVRLGESQISGEKTTPRRPVRGHSIERARTNSQINNNNYKKSSTPKQKENNRLVRSGADRKSRQETQNPKLEETLDEANKSEQNCSIDLYDWLAVPNEISLLNDGNDDGFTSIDDTTLSYLCSGSQATTTTTTQFFNTEDNKSRMDYNKATYSNSIPAKCISKVSVPSSSLVKISAPNKCLTKVTVPNKCSAQEIERKRREAIKRLLERKKIHSQIQSQKVS